MDTLSTIEGTKVLLIDDDRLIRESMMLFLTDKGIELTTCQTLDEALNVLKSDHFDILICDQCLLKDDRENTFDFIKDSDPGMVRVVFTSPAGVDALTEARMEGVDAFILKPFSANTITDVLLRLLRMRSGG